MHLLCRVNNLFSSASSVSNEASLMFSTNDSCELHDFSAMKDSIVSSMYSRKKLQEPQSDISSLSEITDYVALKQSAPPDLKDDDQSTIRTIIQMLQSVKTNDHDNLYLIHIFNNFR